MNKILFLIALACGFVGIAVGTIGLALASSDSDDSSSDSDSDIEAGGGEECSLGPSTFKKVIDQGITDKLIMDNYNDAVRGEVIKGYINENG